MKRIIACLLTGLLAVGMMAGCSKKLTPEEQAASEAAVLAQQLQEEETQTGLKRLISNNLTEYEQPFYDFVDSLQKGDAAAAAKALGVPNTFGDKLQSWVIVNNYETFQKAEMKSICLNSAKDGASAVLNIYMKSPKDVTTDTQPDYTMNVDYVNGAWALTPPTGVIKDYAFSAPTNKVTFEGTDLSSYAAKSAATGEWMVTLPRALDLESNSTYVITNDMGDYNGHVYDVTSDGTVNHILLADLDVDTKATYQAKLEAVLKESYRLLSIGAGETDFSNVLLDSNWTPNGDFMARYKIRQDRRNRKPLPECRLTPQEWNQYWKQLNLAVESQDEEWIYKAKAMVKEQIRSIYTNRCGRDGKCVLCAEKAGYFGLCKKCWRSLMNNAILRSQGHTRAEQQERSEKPCIVCGASPILCRGVCGKCYSSMRAHKFTTPEQLLEYKETKKKRKEQ